MFKSISILLFALFLIGCAGNTPSEKSMINVETGISFESPEQTYTQVNVLSDEIQFHKDHTLLGTVQIVPSLFENITAIESLKEGFREASNGTNKPQELILPETAYGFMVTVKGYSTLWIATEYDTNQWTLISVQTKYVEELIKSISIKSSK